MPTIISGSSGSGSRPKIPPGLYEGVAFMIAQLGTNWHKFSRDEDEEPKKQAKVAIFWEIPSIRDDDDKPATVAHTYTASLGKSARLYKDLIKWRNNKEFTPEELAGFDLENVLGVTCNLDIVMNANDNPKVDGVITATGGAKKVATVHEQAVFELDTYLREYSGNSDAESKRMCDLFEMLLPFQRDMILGSDDGTKEPCFELQAIRSKGGSAPEPVATPPAVETTAPAEEEFEDDIPF